MKIFVAVYLLTTISSANISDIEEINLQLRWKHQFQFAGFYIAKERGFYKEAGLDVKINEYRHPINVVDEVISGRANYGIGRSSLLIDRNKGKPIVALGAIYQNSPSVLITTDPEIKSLQDFRGKKIMIVDDPVQSDAISSMLYFNGLSRNDFILQKHSFNYKDLINRKTDAMACYLSNEPYYLKKSNTPYIVFNPKNYGFSLYADILFTSENEINNHYERVKAFSTASHKGWLWAFDNIEATAKMIYEKYNTQNKSLESLIYEGNMLKDLALVKDTSFGHISKKRFKDIANNYHLGGLLDKEYTLDGFIDPLALHKKEVKIGVLAKRGDEATLKRWNPLAEYLSETLEAFHFTIVPLDFSELSESVAQNRVDFFITNTMYYVQLEHNYGASRIATLLNSENPKEHQLKEFGGVIFTKKDNRDINSIEDIRGKSFAAVNERSFGGWIIGYEELVKNKIDRDDVELEFLNTHDAVVLAVLNGTVDAGTVRTDTLEKMAAEGKIDLSDIKVINKKSYEKFPYLISTALYPEWPFSKLKETSDRLANRVLSILVEIPSGSDVAKAIKAGGWTVPLDYTPVHVMLKKLRVAPYDTYKLNLIDVMKQYAWVLYITSLLFILLVVRLIYIRKVNMHLNSYNRDLNKEVENRTKQLQEANEELKVLAHTDPLTGISNRGYFMHLGKKYFDIAMRNKTPLLLMSLDLDYFKNINDTYGHQAGDKVLIEFTKTITKLLRDSDIFGRVGGEEFSIVLQNTTLDGAKIFAERVRRSIEEMQVEVNNKKIGITVSIGFAKLSDEVKIDDLLQKSDIALYKAKNSGRNRVVAYSK